MSIRTRGLLTLTIAAAVCSFTNGCLYEPYPPVYRVEVAQQDVPAEVLRSFARQYPDATIETIEGNQFKDRIVDYTVFFEEGGQQHRVTIDSTGDVLVPAEVYAAFESQYPEAVITSVSRYDEGQITRYTVLFEKDGQQRRAHFDQAGNALPPPSD